MSVIKDLLLLDRDQGKPDYLTKYLLKKLKKLEFEGDKKKQEEKKKGWSFEDRVCLGLLIAFGILPLAMFYRWALHIFANG